MNILIIDDDEVDRMRARRLLNQIPGQTFVITESFSASEGIKMLENAVFDCVLLDYNLPDGNALDVLKIVDAPSGKISPIIVQTVLDSEDTAVEAINLGAQDYLVKGRFDSATLMRTIRHAIGRDALIKERNRLAEELNYANRHIRTLEGMLSICAYCKKIRNKDEENNWEPLESYIHRKSATDFSHGICPDCLKKHFPETAERLKNKQSL